jgi:hypothetical protein
MRIRLSLIIVSTMGACVVSMACAQKAELGFRFGANIASVSANDITSDSVTRPLVGFVAVIGITSSLSIAPEILLSFEGGEGALPSNMVYPVDVRGTAKLDYLEIPLLLRFDPRISWSVCPFAYSGVSMAFLGDAVAEGTRGTSSQTETTSIADWTSVRDFGLVLGGGAGVGLRRFRLEADLRYTHGLTNVDELEPPMEVKNRCWSASVALLVNFNESM